MDESRRHESDERPGGESTFGPGTSQPGSGESEGFAGTGQPQDHGSETGREWMRQLQSMIDEIATQAAPVARDIGAKAAELAVIAGEKAGPIAHRAADATAVAGMRLAERSRVLAADLRREAAARRAAPGEAEAGTPEGAPPVVADEPPLADEAPPSDADPYRPA